MNPWKDSAAWRQPEGRQEMLSAAWGMGRRAQSGECLILKEPDMNNPGLIPGQTGTT